MTIRRDREKRRLYLGQSGYIERVLKEHDMWNSNPVATPIENQKVEPAGTSYECPSDLRSRYQSAVGSLMFAMLGTRPDIAFAISIVSRFASNPTETHWKLVKRMFRYLRGTVNLQLVYQGDLGPLRGYSDADYAGDIETRRSTSGYLFSLGSAAISWSSKRQPTVALSTCEAEYIAQTQAAKEAIWLQRLIQELITTVATPPIIYCDNEGAVALSKNPEFHSRTKHIDIQWHFVREKVAEGRIELQRVSTANQAADGFTKGLPRELFTKFRQVIGLEAVGA
jgi:hypothetical protein